MTKIDKAALELAMEHARRDKEMAARLKSLLDGVRMSEGRGWACRPEKWEAVAETAAYHCQIEALKLMPWEAPPCMGDDEGDAPGDRLLRRMLAAKISRWHPDPLAALAEAAK